MTNSDALRVAIVIPARFASTRYPGKPLAEIRGATGEAKTLIERSWEAACRVPGVEMVVVATDSDRIRDVSERFGAKVVMTSEACLNGTERCAEVVSKLDFTPDIVVNLQGDAPLTPAKFVTALVSRLAERPHVQVATPAVRCTPALHEKLVADEKLGIVGGTSAVFTASGRALYFSKRLVPHFDPRQANPDQFPAFLHLGVYAYRPAALGIYAQTPVSALENLEGLEQLRFLEAGVPVDVVEVAQPMWEMWELNNPSDLVHIEAALHVMGVP